MYLKNIKKLIQISWIVLAICTLILGGILIKEKHEHKADLDNTKLQNELLLSEKLALEKEIIQLNDTITNLKGKNEQTDKLLTETQRKFIDGETAYSKELRKNTHIKSLQKKLAETSDMNKDLTDKINDLNKENKVLLTHNLELKDSILSKQGEKE